MNNVANFTIKYDLGPLLGKGAFGAVYKCWQAGTHGREQIYAMKELQKARHSRGSGAYLIKNELAILPKTIHPNIVRIFEIFQDKKNYYVVQELMQGGGLVDQISTQRMFSEKKVINIVQQLLGALNFLHENNIVHRDVKSENILLQQSLYSCGEDEVVAKLADFGLACYNDPTEKGLQLFCGSDTYMAPEIIK